MPFLEKRLTKAVRMAIPAEGPSLPMDPSLLQFVSDSPVKTEAIARTACEDG